MTKANRLAIALNQSRRAFIILCCNAEPYGIGSHIDRPDQCAGLLWFCFSKIDDLHVLIMLRQPLYIK